MKGKRSTESFSEQLKECIILDDDEIFLQTVALYVEKLGFQKPATFTRCDEAWTTLKNSSFDFMFMDWKVPGQVSGLALFNRIRRRTNHSIAPILVISGFVDSTDFKLLQEFPCTQVLEKPFTFKIFETKTKELWDEYQWYLENIVDVTRILREFEGQPEKLMEKFKKLLLNSPRPTPLQVLIGQYLMDTGELSLATEIFEQVLNQDPNHLVALTESAKILLREFKNDAALRRLYRANQISPQNIERLCLTGRIELSSDPKLAEETFKKALEIDQKDTTARSGLILARNTQEFFQMAHSGTSLTRNFASLMNAVGVAKARHGEETDAIRQYHSALPFIENDVDRARVMFNIGLAYLKARDLDRAVTWFKRSVKFGGAGFSKAGEYIDRIKMIKLKLRDPTPPPLASGLVAGAVQTGYAIGAEEAQTKEDAGWREQGKPLEKESAEGEAVASEADLDAEAQQAELDSLLEEISEENFFEPKEAG